MTVYVDDAMIPFRRMKMSHLFADTAKELFEMVDKIGVQRKWYQDDSSLPHFDVCASKRLLALEHGAVPLVYGTNKEWITVYRRLKKRFGTDKSRKPFRRRAKQ